MSKLSTVTLLFSMFGLSIFMGCSKSSSSAEDPKTVMVTPNSEDDCEKFRASLPVDWFQGFLQVPEDPSQPNGLKISIFYYGKINPHSVPTMYFNGGPLANSHGDFSILSKHQKLFDPDKQISMVFLDQRGNGCSQAYPQGNDVVTLQRLSLYGSRGIVADAEAVRLKVWGDHPWIAAGQSYGGYIVHRYVTLYPQSLKAAISQQEVLTTDSYFRLKTRIASQARVLENYFTQYPDDRDRLTRLRNYLTIDTCFYNKDNTRKRCGYTALSPLNDVIGFSDNWLVVHQWLGIMAPVDYISEDGINRFLAAYVFNDVTSSTNLKNVAGYVINYVDRNVIPLDTKNCEQIRTDLLTNNIKLDTVLLNECMVALQRKYSSDQDWKKYLVQDPLTIADLTTTLKNTNLPFYLYSAQKDIYVPVEEFAEELTAIGKLNNVHYTNFQSTGHDGSFEEPQTWADWIKLSIN